VRSCFSNTPEITLRGAVNDPRQALETARSFKPDLVIVDLIMPQADGLEVADAARADWASHEVPIVFCDRADQPEEARGGVASTAIVSSEADAAVSI